jgi:hypothetical protein
MNFYSAGLVGECGGEGVLSGLVRVVRRVGVMLFIQLVSCYYYLLGENCYLRGVEFNLGLNVALRLG